MDFLRLRDKVAVVTGGARGIGEEIARYFAAVGARVVICDINESNGPRVAEEIRREGNQAVFMRCDMVNAQEVNAMAEAVIAQFERIDVLVSNAGAGSNRYLVEEITDAEWDRIHAIDLKSTFYACRAVVPHMKKRGYGKIIISSSGGGVAGMAYNSHYAAAKAGLIGFTKSLALELAEYHINVNVIAIPSIVTPGTYDVDYDDDIEAEIAEIPLGRLGLPRDVANMALFLASDASEYVTSQVMMPNGGKR
jgi:NAD(P)-dependent dehydrogenase (short-subunit alcohol dehydrogenase family)